MAAIKNFSKKNKESRGNDLTKKPIVSKKEMKNLTSNDRFKGQFIKWNTFMKENYDIFAVWYLGLDLFLYQKIMLHLMGKTTLGIIIASRGISKSFLLAIYACIKCILEPMSIIVISSATRGQSMLILKEKIQNELCKMSPALAKEIKSIKTSQNEGLVEFHNGSRIIIVTANENSRGHRSNCNLYEESRMIPQNVRDSILAPFLISRQAPYLKKAEYAHLKQEPVEISISSAWYKSLEHFWNEIKTIAENMLNGSEEHLCLGFDYLLAINHGLKTQKQMDKEKDKSDEVSFAIEYENTMFDSEGSFFTYDLFKKTRNLKKALYPRTIEEIASNRKTKRLLKQDGVIRVLSCDIAMASGNTNDNSIYMMAELIPMKGYYLKKISYIESHNGKTALEQALRIRRLIADFDIDICVIDCMTIGLPVLDLLGTQLTDNETGEEYIPLCAYNDEDLKNRCRAKNARPMIFGMRASQQLNSDMIIEMKSQFQQDKVELLLSEAEAEAFLIKTNKDYKDNDSNVEVKVLYELPYAQTTLTVNECIQLETEFKNGKISVKEKSGMRKDRFSALLYLLWVSSLIEKENMKEEDDSIDWNNIPVFVDTVKGW